jgi:hypothetical protein
MRSVIVIFIFLTFFSTCKASEHGIISNYNEIKKIDMSNLEVKLSYIVNKLEINKKYFFSDNKQFFKYVIIGNWHNPPHSVYHFDKDNTFIMKNNNTNQIIQGKWRFSPKGLELNSKGKWEEKKITYCIFEKGEGVNSFSILSNDNMFLLNIDSDIIKVWKKYPPFTQ